MKEWIIIGIGVSALSYGIYRQRVMESELKPDEKSSVSKFSIGIGALIALTGLFMLSTAKGSGKSPKIA